MTDPIDPKKTPEDLVDQFLAAPDITRKSEVEMRKGRERKAKERAREEQLLSSKSATSPTIEDMLGDMVRVAEDEDTNPWWEFRCLSRRRYELYGHYPIRFLDAQFGQFSHALEVAGLRDQPGTTMWRANRARDSRREHAGRYVERYVMPYVARVREHQIVGRSYRLLSISDTHSQFLCPFVWGAFLQAVRDLRPDGVLLNGDIIDGAEISRHPKIPGWTEPLQSELDFKREMFRQVREEGYHIGDLFDTGGNHDVDRLAMYLTQVAPALASLRSLRIDRLLGLDDYGVKLFTGGTIASPAGTEDAKPGFLLFGSYRIHHGTLLGPTPATSELRAAGRSGQSGHTHRADLAYGTSEKDEGLSWMSTPAGCRQEAARAYIRGSSTGWQRGFGYAEIFPDGSVNQHPVVVVGRPEKISVEGFTYTRPETLTDPPCHGQWLSERVPEVKP